MGRTQKVRMFKRIPRLPQKICIHLRDSSKVEHMFMAHNVAGSNPVPLKAKVYATPMMKTNLLF